MRRARRRLAKPQDRKSKGSAEKACLPPPPIMEAGEAGEAGLRHRRLTRPLSYPRQPRCPRRSFIIIIIIIDD